jgi:hypothetical protein
MEISYHYEVLLVGNFLSLKVELTVYISCPKEGFSLGISYHSRLNFHLCIVQEQSNSNLPSCNKSYVRSMYTVGHTRDSNFTCNINQPLTYSHNFTLTPTTITTPSTVTTTTHCYARTSHHWLQTTTMRAQMMTASFGPSVSFFFICFLFN